MRRSFLFLTRLLVVGVGLYVVLVIVTQVHQIQRANPNDLVGSWSIDVEATWDKIRSSPLIPIMAERNGIIDKDEVDNFKTFVLTQFAGAGWQFTADKRIWIGNGERSETGYTITAITEDVLTAECADENGHGFQMKFTVTGNRLEMVSPDSPYLVIVCNRVR